MIPLVRYISLILLILFILNPIGAIHGNHHYMDSPGMRSVGHHQKQQQQNLINNKRNHSEIDKNLHTYGGPQNFVRKTNKRKKVVDNPKIMLVIWGINGEIIEDPHIMLRHMGGVESPVNNAEHLPRTELTPLIDCSEDLPANGIQTEHCHYDLHIGNGVTNITFRNPEIKGKVEISYALDESSQRISYIEDIDKLKVATDPNHIGHNSFHQKFDNDTEATDHRKILHLFYHNFKPYTYIYHIHGIIFWRGDKKNPSPVPLVANEACAHVEYDIEHDHTFGNMPYEFYYDKITGNFRITIKNGYGLDPMRRLEQNYGRIRIAVAYSKQDFRLKDHRVYTIKVSDYLHDSHDNFEKDVNHSFAEKKPSRILYLWADKEKMKYGPFPLRQREYSIELKLNNNNINGNVCDKPFSSAPMNWDKWMKIRDEDDEEFLIIENTKIENQSDGLLIAHVKLYKTIAEGFHLHIDCGGYKAEYVLDSFNHIIDKTEWINLHSTADKNPEVLIRVKYSEQSEQPKKSQFELRYKYSGRGEHPLMDEDFGENNKLPNNSIAYQHDDTPAQPFNKPKNDDMTHSNTFQPPHGFPSHQNMSSAPNTPPLHSRNSPSTSSHSNTFQPPHSFPTHQSMSPPTPNTPQQIHSRNTPSTHYDNSDGYYSSPYSSPSFNQTPFSQQHQDFEQQNSVEDEEGYQDFTDSYPPHTPTKNNLNAPYSNMLPNNPHGHSPPYGRPPVHGPGQM